LLSLLTTGRNPRGKISPPTIEAKNMLDLECCQSFMKDQGIDMWVAYDFRGSNPVFWHLLGHTRSTTRRAFLLIAQAGPPKLLAHIVDQDAFRPFAVGKMYFRSWREMHDLLMKSLPAAGRIAMEYSPQGSIPIVSWVDAGTVELLRGWGHEIVTSAELFQVAAASWNEQALQSHLAVGPLVSAVKDDAFALIAEKVRANTRITEFEVRNFILEAFAVQGLETQHAPVVAVNANSGNPHYEPTAEHSAEIRRGDWLLIDLWARYPGEMNVFSDITWVAYTGTEVPERHRRVFDVVRDGRDAGVAFLQSAWKEGRELKGFEVDALVRERISAAGYNDAFLHRTGHSIAPGLTLHALGVNIDDFETHDTRRIRPGLGFSIEPGVYLPDFGVRLEINVYVDLKSGPRVTSSIQDKVVLLG
jgi:Xaa-Pro dipeptidase